MAFWSTLTTKEKEYFDEYLCAFTCDNEPKFLQYFELLEKNKSKNSNFGEIYCLKGLFYSDTTFYDEVKGKNLITKARAQIQTNNQKIYIDSLLGSYIDVDFKHIKKTRKNLENILSTDKNYYYLYYLIVNSLASEEKYHEKAMEYLEIGLKLKPNFPAFYELKVQLNTLVNEEESLQSFDTAIRLSNYDISIMLSKADYLLTTNRIEEFKEFMLSPYLDKNMIQKYPSYFDVMYCYYKLINKQREAINSFKKVIELAPNIFSYKKFLVVLSEPTTYKECFKYVEIYREKFGDCSFLYRICGSLERKMEKSNEFYYKLLQFIDNDKKKRLKNNNKVDKNQIEKKNKREDEDDEEDEDEDEDEEFDDEEIYTSLSGDVNDKEDLAEAYYNISLNYLEMGRGEDSVKAISQAIKLDGGNLEYSLHFTKVLVILHRMEDALNIIMGILDEYPDEVLPLMTYADLMDLEHPFDVIKRFKKFLERKKDAEIAARLAEIYIGVGSFDKGLKCFDLAFEIDKTELGPMIEKGRVLDLLGRIDDRDRCFELLSPDNEDLITVQSTIYYEAGEFGRYFQYLGDKLEKFPENLFISSQIYFSVLKNYLMNPISDQSVELYREIYLICEKCISSYEKIDPDNFLLFEMKEIFGSVLQLTWVNRWVEINNKNNLQMNLTVDLIKSDKQRRKLLNIVAKRSNIQLDDDFDDLDEDEEGEGGDEEMMEINDIGNDEDEGEGYEEEVGDEDGENY